MPKGFISRTLLTAFIAMLAVVPACILFSPGSHQSIDKNDKLLTTAQQDLVAILSATPTPIKKQHIIAVKKTPTATAIPSPSPKPIAMKVESFEDKNSSTYISSDKNFSFTYSSQWKVTGQKNNTVYTLFFSLSDSTDKGQFMNIVVLDPASSVQEVIAKEYPQYSKALRYQQDGFLGNMPLYKITSTDNSFGSFGIVLGEKHAYVVSFDDNGNRNIIDQIEKQIWPTFKFE